MGGISASSDKVVGFGGNCGFHGVHRSGFRSKHFLIIFHYFNTSAINLHCHYPTTFLPKNFHIIDFSLPFFQVVPTQVTSYCSSCHSLTCSQQLLTLICLKQSPTLYFLPFNWTIFLLPALNFCLPKGLHTIHSVCFHLHLIHSIFLVHSFAFFVFSSCTILYVPLPHPQVFKSTLHLSSIFNCHFLPPSYNITLLLLTSCVVLIKYTFNSLTRV